LVQNINRLKNEKKEADRSSLLPSKVYTYRHEYRKRTPTPFRKNSFKNSHNYT